MNLVELTENALTIVADALPFRFLMRDARLERADLGPGQFELRARGLVLATVLVDGALEVGGALGRVRELLLAVVQGCVAIRQRRLERTDASRGIGETLVAFVECAVAIGDGGLELADASAQLVDGSVLLGDTGAQLVRSRVVVGGGAGPFREHAFEVGDLNRKLFAGVLVFGRPAPRVGQLLVDLRPRNLGLGETALKLFELRLGGAELSGERVALLAPGVGVDLRAVGFLVQARDLVGELRLAGRRVVAFRGPLGNLRVGGAGGFVCERELVAQCRELQAGLVGLAFGGFVGFDHGGELDAGAFEVGVPAFGASVCELDGLFVDDDPAGGGRFGRFRCFGLGLRHGRRFRVRGGEEELLRYRSRYRLGEDRVVGQGSVVRRFGDDFLGHDGFGCGVAEERGRRRGGFGGSRLGRGGIGRAGLDDVEELLRRFQRIAAGFDAELVEQHADAPDRLARGLGLLVCGNGDLLRRDRIGND